MTAETTTLTLSVDTYSFAEFCEAIQKYIQDGWEFDFESNERYPTNSFGGYYHVIMIKKDKNSKLVLVETPEVTEVLSQVTSETTEKTKPGRKPKTT